MVKKDFEPEGQIETAGQQTESSSDNPDSQDVQSYPEQVNVSDIFQFDDTLFVRPVKDKVYKTRAERRRCRQERSEERVSQEALINARQSELDIQNWSEREREACLQDNNFWGALSKVDTKESVV